MTERFRTRIAGAAALAVLMFGLPAGPSPMPSQTPN